MIVVLFLLINMIVWTISIPLSYISCQCDTKRYRAVLYNIGSRHCITGIERILQEEWRRENMEFYQSLPVWWYMCMFLLCIVAYAFIIDDYTVMMGYYVIIYFIFFYSPFLQFVFLLLIGLCNTLKSIFLFHLISTPAVKVINLTSLVYFNVIGIVPKVVLHVGQRRKISY